MNKTLVVASLLLSNFAIALGGGSSIGVPNPAAENCIKLGGKLEATNDAEGQNANCVIEEWKLYTAMEKHGVLKPIHIGNGGANPSSINCIQSKGTERSMTDADGEYSDCVIEQWTLFRIFNPEQK